MSALENEIVEKFHQLDQAAKERVRKMIGRETGKERQSEAFNDASWSREIEAVRQQIRQSHGVVFPEVGAVGMLRDIRDGEDE